MQPAVNMHFWIQGMNVKYTTKLNNTKRQMDDPRP